MELIDQKLMNQQIQAILKDKVEQECFLCLGQFDLNEYAPVLMCINQHSCCGPCMQQLIKDGTKMPICPHCSQPINKKIITKNRYLITVFELVDAFKRYVSDIQMELETLRKQSNPNPNIYANPNQKSSLTTHHPRLVNSFIINQQSQKFLKDSSLFQDFPTSRSQTWIGSRQKRRETLLAYAQREKIEQLKKIANGDIALQEVTIVRSGYGTIKRIQCMEYLINLKELFLYNNHIKIIQGLNNNLKLTVLSLAYNRIQKVENLGHLKQLKRLSLQSNKLTKSSAEYLSLYQWKNLQSLTISFHEEKKQDNEECLSILFSGKSLIQWSSLKTIYVYNSKALGETGKSGVKQFVGRRKTNMQVYWS